LMIIEIARQIANRYPELDVSMLLRSYFILKIPRFFILRVFGSLVRTFEH
jgi:hypothetical protein